MTISLVLASKRHVVAASDGRLVANCKLLTDEATKTFLVDRFGLSATSAGLMKIGDRPIGELVATICEALTPAPVNLVELVRAVASEVRDRLIAVAAVEVALPHRTVDLVFGGRRKLTAGERMVAGVRIAPVVTDGSFSIVVSEDSRVLCCGDDSSIAAVMGRLKSCPDWWDVKRAQLGWIARSALDAGIAAAGKDRACGGACGLATCGGKGTLLLHPKG